jgi:glycosyltransferase involved in cell wall biosynthesis
VVVDQTPDLLTVPGLDVLEEEDLTGALAALAAPELDPLFRRPTRTDVDSAWYGHVPFAQWLMRAARPRVFVELGSHAGVSYGAFCEAVIREKLDTRCFAVDTWQGDSHAGFYDESVFLDLRNFHDARYGTFSSMLRTTFEEALPYVADGSVDLLHVDGRHGYEDVRTDFESWRRKLSDRAVVLFHDTNERQQDFGVWRLWAELRDQYPSFEFLHAHGLGVLLVGPNAPAEVAALCRPQSPATIAAVRERFALIGERWEVQEAARQLRIALEDKERRLHEEVKEMQARFEVAAKEMQTHFDVAAKERRTLLVALAEARQKVRHGEQAPPPQLAELLAHVRKLEEERAIALSSAHRLEEERAAILSIMRRLEEERTIILSSNTWRLAAPLRKAVALVRALRGRPRPEVAPVVPAAIPDQCAPELDVQAPKHTGRKRILYASGEPSTPGSIYRCLRYADAARDSGWEAETIFVGDVNDKILTGLDVIVLWRVEWSDHVEGVVNFARSQGVRIVFDVDDLMIKPDLARLDVIDGIRTIGTTEAVVQAMFTRVRQVMDAADLCTTTTTELARHLRESAKAVHVLPNGFDDASHATARLARRTRQAGEQDGLVRLGYAGGTVTHQRDFKVLSDALARVLRERPDTRLVLFQEPKSKFGLVMTSEFPELSGLEDRIEWRDMVPLADLPNEIARFDINLAPLEHGNPFCEAKSELKFFEAALADVCTIASPTGPFRRAIRQDVTGFLATDEAEWYETMLRLVDDPALRQRTARAAYHDVLWTFGPQRRAALTAAFLAQTGDNEPEAARAFELQTRRGAFGPLGCPQVPASETLFAHDDLRQAEVTVVVASYNYAGYVLEALESVRAQTLERLDLIVVDDGSSDESVELILEWARRHSGRFCRLLVLRNIANAGLGGTRNTAFDAAETPFVLPLDSDNRLLPHCAERLLTELKASDAAYAYPQIQHFDASTAIMGNERYQPARLVGGNFIDAMALVAKWAWAAAGGYYVRKEAMGWEDYDLWCGLADLGQYGRNVPEVLAEYRVHASSMVNAITETSDNKTRMVELVESRHRWLDVLGRTARKRA